MGFNSGFKGLIQYVTEEGPFDSYSYIFFRVLKPVKRFSILVSCYYLPRGQTYAESQNSTIFYLWQDERNHVLQVFLYYNPP